MDNMQFMGTGGRVMNYFKEDKPENNDTIKREEERSRTSLYDAANYDMVFVNGILNGKMTEEDKFNIARVVEWFNYELREANDYACKFERFLCKLKKYIENEMKEFWSRVNAN